MKSGQLSIYSSTVLSIYEILVVSKWYLDVFSFVWCIRYVVIDNRLKNPLGSMRRPQWMTWQIILTGQLKVNLSIYCSGMGVNIYFKLFVSVLSASIKNVFLFLQHKSKAVFTPAILITPTAAQHHLLPPRNRKIMQVLVITGPRSTLWSTFPLPLVTQLQYTQVKRSKTVDVL